MECYFLGYRIANGIEPKRCSMIIIDPERDPSLLKKVNEEMNLNFGVYASVKKTGQIQIGDKVYLVD